MKTTKQRKTFVPPKGLRQRGPKMVPNIFGPRPTENPEQVLAQIPGLDFLKKPPSSVPSPSNDSNNNQSLPNDDDENKPIPFRRCLERSVHQQKHLVQQLHEFHQYITKKRSVPKETLDFGNNIWLQQQQQQQQQHCLFETQQQQPLFEAQQQQQPRLMDESSDDLANLETKFHYF